MKNLSSRVRLVLSLVLAALVASSAAHAQQPGARATGSASAAPRVEAPRTQPPGGAAAEDPAPSQAVYRLDVTVTGLDEPGRAPPATYTLMLQEHRTGEVSTGANIPLMTGSAVAPGVAVQRADVGLRLRFTYRLRGAVLLLEGDLELSSVDPAPSGGPAVIRRVHAAGNAAVTPGTPTLFTSAFDVATRRRVECNVTAQRVL